MILSDVIDVMLACGLWQQDVHKYFVSSCHDLILYNTPMDDFSSGRVCLVYYVFIGYVIVLQLLKFWKLY